MVNEIAKKRNTEEVLKLSNQLYEILKNDIKKCINKTSQCRITYTPERKIGKTYTLIRLANEYDCPIIVGEPYMAKLVRATAEYNDMGIPKIYTMQQAAYLKEYSVVLKEEKVDAVELTGKLAGTGINLVGIN